MKLQITLDNLKMWTNDWIMKVNAAKNNLHDIHTVNEQNVIYPHTKWAETMIKNNPKYLGITFDPRMT